MTRASDAPQPAAARMPSTVATQAPATALERRFVARLSHAWEDVEARWAPLLRAQNSGPFQTCAWLRRWYASIGSLPQHDPLLVEVVDEATQKIALALPLVRVIADGLRTIEFADGGITDYNLPLLGEQPPVGATQMRAALAALRKCLPEADLLHFTKMPHMAGARANPLIEALPTQPSRMFGNDITLGDSYDDWLKALPRKDRKEIGRFWRVFTREPGTFFLRAGTVEEARPVLEMIERSQRERIAAAGLAYQLDEPGYRDVYRALMAEGIADGSVIVTALMAGDEVVAGLFGIADGTRYCMLRVSMLDGAWERCSPGRLLIERSIHRLHEEGYRAFDFTIGDYAHKRVFSPRHVALSDAHMALSWKGVPRVAAERLKALVRHRAPRVVELIRRVRRATALDGDLTHARSHAGGVSTQRSVLACDFRQTRSVSCGLRQSDLW